jgi:hypothetical protein
MIARDTRTHYRWVDGAGWAFMYDNRKTDSKPDSEKETAPSFSEGKSYARRVTIPFPRATLGANSESTLVAGVVENVKDNQFRPVRLLLSSSNLIDIEVLSVTSEKKSIVAGPKNGYQFAYDAKPVIPLQEIPIRNPLEIRLHNTGDQEVSVAAVIFAEVIYESIFDQSLAQIPKLFKDTDEK